MDGVHNKFPLVTEISHSFAIFMDIKKNPLAKVFLSVTAILMGPRRELEYLQNQCAT